MYELVQVANNTYYVNCPAKIGIYRCEDNGVYLIDSGNDKDAGRKLRRILEAEGWTLKAILNTHSNADHVGGNKYLQQNTGCKIFAPGIEADITRHPILEPAFLYGGYPCKDLRHKFLMAQESSVKPLTDAAFPKEITPVPLPGHYFGQTGYKTADGVFFIADSLCSRETLDKYTITVLYDIKAELATLDLLESAEAKLFVPAHAPASEDISELVRYNRQKIFEVKEHILDICSEPHTFEEVLQMIFTDYGLTMNFEQYVLVGSTVKSYLAWLKEEKLLDAVFENNRLLWKAVL